MKGRIEEDGFFVLERGGAFKDQTCPFNSGDTYCGDWCPLFGEPESEYDNVAIELSCGDGRFWAFGPGDFTDEREANADES